MMQGSEFMEPQSDLPNTDRTMKWITREKVKLDRSHAPRSLSAAAQLFQGQKGVFQRRGRGSQQQGQLTMRKSYGFSTFLILELALYQSLGKLPEPELTH